MSDASPSMIPKPKKSVALSGVPAGNTALCTVGRSGNDLHYRGYDILDFADTAEFEEVAYLLVHDHLPTKAELDKLSRGAALDRMIDEYLQSQEFKDFYFHRIRLYLESHGTELQDEPVRLWCYVVFNDRPFQEILTARYTVDSNFQKQPRPLHYGSTGVLTTRGFMEGKPGLPHFNYAAQVAELFLGYVFEVPPEVVAQREGITAVATTDPNSLCYSCHKVLTPLAFQRNRWDDDGHYRAHDDYGLPIDDSDQKLVVSYPFKGDGLEAFALQAVKKERFIRTIINTHFTFYFGREVFIEDLVGKVSQKNLVVVVGPSGIGKSSVVLARCPASEAGPAPDQKAYEPLFQAPKSGYRKSSGAKRLLAVTTNPLAGLTSRGILANGITPDH